MRRFLKLIAIMMMFLCVNTFAASAVTGYWTTLDDKTGKPSSLIYIWQKDQLFYGKIAKIYREDGQKNTDRCTKCTGEQHNKPMLGLTIIRDMKAEYNRWTDGLVLDPRNGKEYHAQMWLEKNGSELHLRGYIGLPLFGRTAVWYRHNKRDN